MEAKIALVLAVGAVGVVAYVATKNAQAAASNPSGTQLVSGQSYSAMVSATSDPTTAITAALPGAQVSPAAVGGNSYNVLFTAAANGPPPVIAGVTWSAVSPSAAGPTTSMTTTPSPPTGG